MGRETSVVFKPEGLSFSEALVSFYKCLILTVFLLKIYLCLKFIRKTTCTLNRLHSKFEYIDTTNLCSQVNSSWSFSCSQIYVFELVNVSLTRKLFICSSLFLFFLIQDYIGIKAVIT